MQTHRDLVRVLADDIQVARSQCRVCNISNDRAGGPSVSVRLPSGKSRERGDARDRADLDKVPSVEMLADVRYELWRQCLKRWHAVRASEEVLSCPPRYQRSCDLAQPDPKRWCSQRVVVVQELRNSLFASKGSRQKPVSHDGKHMVSGSARRTSA